uniref:Major facilitator superfamily (MFS) profile domain-containing protein n=1 Tax=Rhodosorus marinus TaxID=101924 RepID=A0A7S3EHS3_9RHOD
MAVPQVITRSQRISVLVTAIVTVMIFSDQNLMSPNLTMIAKDFGLDASGRDWLLGGMLSTLFFLVGAPASIIAGVLADTRRRVPLLSAFMLVGAIPCVLTMFVQNYYQLLATRTFTGMAIGGVIPIIFSYLGDIFPNNMRNYVSGGFGFVSGAGQAVGQFLAGATGESLGWRFCFPAIGIPSILVALGALFICEEPKRGAADGQQKFGSGFSWDSVVNILRIRSNVLIFLQAGFGCVPWGIITAYLNDYLAQEGGLEVLNATYVIMLFSIGAALGGVFGSVTGQYLQNKNRALLGIFMGATTILSIPPILGLVLIPNGIKYLPIFFALAIVGGFLASPTGANVPAVVVNSNTPETRGSALAIFNMCNDVGKGLGPLIGAALIGVFGRRIALTIAITSWLPCGVLCLLLSITYPSDEDNMKERIKTATDEESAELMAVVEE